VYGVHIPIWNGTYDINIIFHLISTCRKMIFQRNKWVNGVTSMPIYVIRDLSGQVCVSFSTCPLYPRENKEPLRNHWIHVRYLWLDRSVVFRRNEQTDLNGPIRRSSFTLKHKEHLKFEHSFCVHCIYYYVSIMSVHTVHILIIIITIFIFTPSYRVSVHMLRLNLAPAAHYIAASGKCILMKKAGA
jgi:hypothetical protein